MLCKRGVGLLIYMYECMVTVLDERDVFWLFMLGIDWLYLSSL